MSFLIYLLGVVPERAETKEKLEFLKPLAIFIPNTLFIIAPTPTLSDERFNNQVIIFRDCS